MHQQQILLFAEIRLSGKKTTFNILTIWPKAKSVYSFKVFFFRRKRRSGQKGNSNRFVSRTVPISKYFFASAAKRFNQGQFRKSNLTKIKSNIFGNKKTI